MLLNATLRQQFSSRYSLQASYTFSKVTGNTLFGSDEFRLGGTSFSACNNDCSLDFTIGPRDDPRMIGPLNTDARHRIVIAGAAELPYQFRFSGFFRANSALPYNAFFLPDDGTGFEYTIRDPHVNSRSGKGFCQFDMRIARTFEISSVRVDAILDVYNLFNADNPSELIGNQDLPEFGQPTMFGDPRQTQIGFRIEF